MATQALVSVAEYLKSAYSPDCDYVDGVVEERQLGERDHAWIQTQIATFIMSRFRQTGIAAIVEWRFQTSPTRFRVPDVVVVRGKPEEQILTTPPLLCIEILSPDDRNLKGECTDQRVSGLRRACGVDGRPNGEKNLGLPFERNERRNWLLNQS